MKIFCICNRNDEDIKSQMRQLGEYDTIMECVQRRIEVDPQATHHIFLHQFNRKNTFYFVLHFAKHPRPEDNGWAMYVLKNPKKSALKVVQDMIKSLSFDDDWQLLYVDDPLAKN